MNKENTLILINAMEPFGLEIQSLGYHIDSIYKPCSFFKRIIRRMFLQKLKIFRSMWYGSWFNNLNEFDNLIIFNILLDDEIIKDIHSKRNLNRFIIWNWDPLIKNKNIMNLKHLDYIELWSFDENDCKVANMNHNTQFYFESIKPKEKDVIYDICFIGRDKGREAFLLKFSDILDCYGLKYYFYIVHNNKEYINYSEMLDVYSQSKAIIDIVQEGQTGLTLRVLESIFLKKKLITNNKFIHSFNFYNKNNIFIIGIDDPKQLQHFLSTPFQEINPNSIMYYSFEAWFERFKK